MLRGNRNAVVLTLVVCALSSSTVLAKHHHKSHKPSSKISGGTLSLGTNSFQVLAPLSVGTLEATPNLYQGLIINSGYESLFVNPVEPLTLTNSYQGSSTVSYGTLTVSNIASFEPAGTIVLNSTQNFPASAGVLSVELSNYSSSMGTLLINNAVNYFGGIDLAAFQQSAGSLTLLANSNVVIPSDIIVLSSGTFSPDVPEPTGLGWVAIAALAFLRRQHRK
jgi:hypothetical protein